MSDRETPPWLQPVPDDEDEGGLFSGKMMMIIAGLAAVFVVLFVAAIFVFGTEDTSTDTPRVITASSEPIKVRPEDSGGTTIENQDKEIFERAGGTDVEDVATLGEQPERLIVDEPLEEATAPISEAAQQALDDVVESVTEAAKIESVKQDSVAPAATVTETKPEPKPAATAVPQPTTGFLVQLGAYGTRERAEQAWPRLRDKFRQNLGSLQVYYEPVVSGDRTLYRLRAGSIPTRADGDRICLALKSEGQGCIVVQP